MAGSKRPRQEPLLDDAGEQIAPIHHAAFEYARAHADTLAAKEAEAEARTKLLGLMEKHDRTTYQAQGVRIIIRPGADKLLVTVALPGDDD